MEPKPEDFKIPGTSHSLKCEVGQLAVAKRQFFYPKPHVTPPEGSYQASACSKSGNPRVNTQLQGFSKRLSSEISDALHFPPVSLAELDQLDDWAILDELEVPEDIGKLAEIQLEDADKDECILFREFVVPGTDRGQAGAHSEVPESLAQHEVEASTFSKIEVPLGPVVPEDNQLLFSRCQEDDLGSLGHESHQLQVLLDTFEYDPSVKVNNLPWGTDMNRLIPEEHLVDEGCIGSLLLSASELAASHSSPSECFDYSPIELSPEDFAMAEALFGKDQDLEVDTHNDVVWTEEQLEYAVHEFLMSQSLQKHRFPFGHGSQPVQKALATNQGCLAYQPHGVPGAGHGGPFDYGNSMHSRPRFQQIQGSLGAHHNWVGQQLTHPQDLSLGYQHLQNNNFRVHEGFYGQGPVFGYPSVFESIFSGIPTTPQDQLYGCSSMPSLVVGAAHASPQDSRNFLSEMRALPRAPVTRAIIK